MCGDTPLTGGKWRHIAIIAETVADARDGALLLSRPARSIRSKNYTDASRKPRPAIAGEDDHMARSGEGISLDYRARIVTLVEALDQLIVVSGRHSEGDHAWLTSLVELVGGARPARS
jgi:hypothetical protein